MSGGLGAVRRVLNVRQTAAPTEWQSANEVDGARFPVVNVITGEAIPAVTTGVPWTFFDNGLIQHRLNNGDALVDVGPIFSDHHFPYPFIEPTTCSLRVHSRAQALGDPPTRHRHRDHRRRRRVWIVSAKGSFSAYGDAPDDGGMGGLHLNGAIIAGTGW